MNTIKVLMNKTEVVMNTTEGCDESIKGLMSTTEGCDIYNLYKDQAE